MTSTASSCGLETVRSAGFNAAVVPLVSVVVPFHEYDAMPLLRDLVDKMKITLWPVELVLLDDGSPSRSFFENLHLQVKDIDVAVQVVRSNENLGRSGARNLLVRLSRAEHLVFLDSDMLPDRADYLERYVAAIHAGVQFAYGGRSVARCQRIPSEHRLHWYFTRRFEQVPPDIRALKPALFFLSSNFLVSRQIIERISLDLRFKGWGWEDCEWANRVVAQHPLEHIDNSATHLGLITISEILRKYQESVANYALVLSACPGLVLESPLHRTAVAISRWRLGPAARVFTSYLLDAKLLPLAIRVRLLQLYKASLYASVVSRPRPAERQT